MPPSPPPIPNLTAAFTAARARWKGNGPGSLPHKVAALSTALGELLRKLDVARVLDLGCGDAHWIVPALALGKVTSYVGVDVTPEPIAANRAQWDLVASMTKPVVAHTFLQISGPADVLPEADLVICRDVLAHLPTHVVTATLAQARRAAPWLLATTMPQTRLNADLRIVGGYRPLDLAKKPFDLGAPVRLLPDSDHKQMGLWDWRAIDADDRAFDVIGRGKAVKP